MTTDTMTTLHHLDILRQIFGHTTYRGHQQAIIEHTIAGGDTLVLMPTGQGKSLCYQIPALARPGVTIVISPLIALMQNQVKALKDKHIPAACLNSALDYQTVQQVRRQFLKGQLKLLYVAPERLLTPYFLELISQVNIGLFAIDEAHCVSQWGHDFRKEYMALDILKERFPQVPRMALTATADEQTKQDIINKLGLTQAQVFVSSFNRPNIHYQVVVKQNPHKQLLEFIKKKHATQSGIVYCMTRKKTEDTAAFLKQHQFKAFPYHAGMNNEEREHHLYRFLNEDPIIIVATIAFGMGIDKPNVRFIAHLDLPKNLEAYYQETGRAGRDGLPANAWMAYGMQDVVTLSSMMSESDASEHIQRREQHKLNAMLGYCETTLCRRHVILQYFGENYQGPCGHCDNCQSEISFYDGTIVAQKALSCVYRTQQVFGVQHLIQVLRGQKTERVKKFKHHKLTTFGIGQDLSTKEWQSVFRQLIAAGILSVDIEGYGGLKLSDRSVCFLKNKTRIKLRKETIQK